MQENDVIENRYTLSYLQFRKCGMQRNLNMMNEQYPYKKYYKSMLRLMSLRGIFYRKPTGVDIEFEHEWIFWYGLLPFPVQYKKFFLRVFRERILYHSHYPRFARHWVRNVCTTVYDENIIGCTWQMMFVKLWGIVESGTGTGQLIDDDDPLQVHFESRTLEFVTMDVHDTSEEIQRYPVRIADQWLLLEVNKSSTNI